MPKLSVLVITHNQPKLLMQLAYSLALAAGGPEDMEFLVYQSGNPLRLDEGYLQSRLVGALNDDFSRIVVIEDPLNLGCTIGFNTLLTLAQGDYLLLLNDDMIAGPNWFPPLEKVLVENPRVGLVCSYLDNNNYNYSRTPATRDALTQIQDFTRRAEPLSKGPGGLVGSESNQPWLIRRSNLYRFDMADPIVNRRRWLGQWEDPTGRFWYADWHAHRKVKLAGFETGMVSNSVFYHYDHTTLKAFDRNEPGWTNESAKRYHQIWGTMEKDMPVPTPHWLLNGGRLLPAP